MFKGWTTHTKQRHKTCATQPCIPFALAASTVAMLIGVEEGGEKRESSKAAKNSKYNSKIKTVNPATVNRGNRWQNTGQHPWHTCHYGCKIHSSYKNLQHVSGRENWREEDRWRLKVVRVLKGHEDLGVESWGGIWLSSKTVTRCATMTRQDDTFAQCSLNTKAKCTPNQMFVQTRTHKQLQSKTRRNIHNWAEFRNTQWWP